MVWRGQPEGLHQDYKEARQEDTECPGTKEVPRPEGRPFGFRNEYSASGRRHQDQ
jgi:hypothetical protein